MANRIQVSQEITILELFASGWPKLRIARELGVDVKTVRRCIREAARANSKSLLLHLREGGEADSKGTLLHSRETLGKTQISCPEADSKSLLLPPGKSGRFSQCEVYRERIKDAVENGLTAQRIHQDRTPGRHTARRFCVKQPRTSSAASRMHSGTSVAFRRPS